MVVPRHTLPLICSVMTVDSLAQRECGEDILGLAKDFLYCYSTEGQRKISSCEPLALTALQWQAVDDSLKPMSRGYAWHGKH